MIDCKRKRLRATIADGGRLRSSVEKGRGDTTKPYYWKLQTLAKVRVYSATNNTRPEYCHCAATKWDKKQRLD